LMVLADRYNEDFGYAWPSLKHLAEDALLSRSQACLLLRSLERKGVISRERRWKGPHECENTAYRFPALDSQRGSPNIGQGGKSSGAAHRTSVVRSLADHGSPIAIAPEPAVNQDITDSAEPFAQWEETWKRQYEALYGR
jgi:hypothetical protein